MILPADDASRLDCSFNVAALWREGPALRDLPALLATGATAAFLFRWPDADTTGREAATGRLRDALDAAGLVVTGVATGAGSVCVLASDALTPRPAPRP